MTHLAERLKRHRRLQDRERRRRPVAWFTEEVFGLPRGIQFWIALNLLILVAGVLWLALW